MIDCAEIASKASPKDWLAVGVSLASLYISFVAYSRATPKLMLNMWQAKIFAIEATKQSDEQYLCMQVVNLSTRPVTITNLGGHYNNRVSRFLRERLPWLGKARSMVWADIQPLVFDSGKPRILRDGERVAHQIPIRPTPEASTSSWDDIKSVWVSDATGREFYLSRKALKKLKADFRE